MHLPVTTGTKPRSFAVFNPSWCCKIHRFCHIKPHIIAEVICKWKYYHYVMWLLDSLYNIRIYVEIGVLKNMSNRVTYCVIRNKLNMQNFSFENLEIHKVFTTLYGIPFSNKICGWMMVVLCRRNALQLWWLATKCDRASSSNLRAYDGGIVNQIFGEPQCK